MRNSLYLHIPFCQKKCNYCSFVSFEGADEFYDEYFRALIKEVEYKVAGKRLKTLYVGGGTPSLVPLKYYQQLSFDFEDNYEFTLEVNPGTVDREYLQGLRELGVNRLSIGVQSFDDEILKIIGRSHSAKDAVDCVKTAREVGFENISIDLIYGLPNQTSDIWENTLKQAVGLNIEHISAYGLKIEDGTPFGKNPPQNLADDDLCADMYLKCIEILSKNGFEHYEISNFAKWNYSSEHNVNYWKNNDYIACGVAAHGYENGVRYENVKTLQEYIKEPLKPLAQIKLPGEDIIEEAIFLGLRMCEGLHVEEFNARYGVDFLSQYASVLEKYKEFFLQKNGRIALTTQGLMLSNHILSEFVAS